MNIEIIAGSPRQGSVTFRVALFLQRLLQHTTSHRVQITDVREWEFPLMQQEVFNTPEHAPENLQPLVKRILDANAFIIITPEYNGSYTPAVKVLFDHFPKQYRKAFGIVTTSTGALGGIRASQQLHLLINALFGIASPYMLITPYVDQKFDETGNLTEAAFQRNIDVFVKEFLWLAESLAPLLEISE